MRIPPPIYWLSLAVAGGATIAIHLGQPYAQSQNVLQSGQVTPGHLAGWVANGIIGDGGNVLIASPVQGDAVCTNASGGMIDCGFPLTIGVTSGQLPFGQVAGTPQWKTPSGDCTTTTSGAFTCTKTNGVALGVAPSAGQLVVGQSANAYAPTTMSGDCTFSSTGAITCTKTNGVAFGVAPSSAQVMIAQSPTAYAPQSISGDCTVTVAGVLTCTKTSGVTFPTFGTIAAQNYVQSTWTPTLQGSSTTGAPTYTTQVGSYEQIGRQVTARFTIVTTALGSPTGNMQIGGLPLASANVANDNGSCVIASMTGVTLDASYVTLTGIVQPNTQVVALTEIGSAQTSASTAVGKFAAATTLTGYCIYHT